MKAESLKRIDEERDIHLQAFLNQVAKSTKGVGKKQVPIYKKFDDFYNHKKEENKILGKREPTNKRFVFLINKANDL